MAGPLSHIRVLDLSRVLAGPWAGQNLADLGAEVIKVERPKVGDDSRAFGPPWVKDHDGRDTRDSAYFTSRQPRQEIDHAQHLASPKGQTLVRELAAQVRRADRELQVRRPGALRPGLRRPEGRSIRASSTARSPASARPGPYRERPGYDFMIQGMGGMMSVTGEPDGAPGGGPQRAGVPVADIITGMYASIAICAALAHRAETGVGQHLDLALLDSQIALLAYQNTNYFATGTPPKRIGNLHPNIVPYQPFRTAGRRRHPRLRQRQPVTASSARRPGCARARRRSALRQQRQARGEPRRTDAPAAGDLRAGAARANGWSCSKRRACPTGRSTTSRRCSRSRR